MKYKTEKQESGMLRIICVTAFGIVSEGENGGLIESEKNLDQSGKAWVYGNAQVSGDALVYGNAWVSGNARVSGNADFILIGPIGSRKAFTTFCVSEKKEILVFCGCWSGTMSEFKKRVSYVHSGQFLVEYNSAISFAENVIKITEVK